MNSSIVSLDYFESLLDTHYPISKLDLLPIPDFVVQGMENVGLITILEDCLTLQPDSPSSALEKQYAATLISQDTSHLTIYQFDIISLSKSSTQAQENLVLEVSGPWMKPRKHCFWTQGTKLPTRDHSKQRIRSHELLHL